MTNTDVNSHSSLAVQLADTENDPVSQANIGHVFARHLPKENVKHFNAWPLLALVVFPLAIWAGIILAIVKTAK